MEKRKIVLAVFGMLTATVLYGQNLIRGTVRSASSMQPVAGAQVFCRQTFHGTQTDSTGHFELALSGACKKLEIYAPGYEKRVVTVHTADAPLKIFLEPLSYSLNQITISAAMVQDEEQPVAITNISARTIHTKLSDNPLPLVFNGDPSVYSVRNGGGSGDAKLSLRGFQQENVAILLNGIPINGAENGLMFWSNWLGLNDVLAKVQIQKGPGYTNIVSNAVGGSINIVTDGAVKQKGGSVTVQTTHYGNTKTGFSYNSGKTKRNLFFSAAVSAFAGPGYIEATPVRGFSYFLTAKKIIDSRNSLTFTLIGAPQYHEQRTLKLTKEETENHGYLYNKDWGWYLGKKRNASANFYHKPFFTADYNMKINRKTKLTHTLYFSYGTGGGKWSESFQYAPSVFEYRDANGRIDWETIVENNKNNSDRYLLANGDTVTGFSKNVQTRFLASHVETGYLGSLQYTVSKRTTLGAGLHYRYFRSFLREEISDLLGGKFFIEDYSWSLAGVAGRNQIMYPGDIIKVNNRSVINLLNGYVRLKYNAERMRFFVSLKGSDNRYRRIDNYNYITNTVSKTVSKPGIDIRAGIGVNANNRIHLLFANGAYISKAPYFKYVFGNFTNTPVQNIRNEHFITAEAGYKLLLPQIKAKISTYYTLWDNVSMLTNEYVQLENNQLSRAMINGLKSVHKGIEAEIHYKMNDFVTLGALVSMADYRWVNDVTAKLINNGNAVTDTVNVFLKGVHVGGTAQQKAGISADFRLFKSVSLNLEGYYFNRLYADFNPVNRNTPEDYPDAYRFPAYTVVNGYLQIPFKIERYHAFIAVNGFNLLNSHYIETGEDGPGHNLDSFKGFWSFGRTVSLMVKMFF